jgi:hypothetical protein
VSEVCIGLEMCFGWSVFALYCCILPDAGSDALCFAAELGSNGQIGGQVVQICGRIVWLFLVRRGDLGQRIGRP